MGIAAFLFSHTGGNPRTDRVNRYMCQSHTGRRGGTWTPGRALWLKNWSCPRHSISVKSQTQDTGGKRARADAWATLRSPSRPFPPFCTDQPAVKDLRSQAAIFWKEKKMLPQIFSLGLLKAFHLIIKRIQLHMDWTVFMDLSSKFNQAWITGQQIGKCFFVENPMFVL